MERRNFVAVATTGLAGLLIPISAFAKGEKLTKTQQILIEKAAKKIAHKDAAGRLSTEHLKANLLFPKQILHPTSTKELSFLNRSGQKICIKQMENDILLSVYTV